MDQSRKQSRKMPVGSGLGDTASHYRRQQALKRCAICDGVFKGLQSVMVAGQRVHRGQCEVKAVNADRYKLCAELRATRSKVAALESGDSGGGADGAEE